MTLQECDDVVKLILADVPQAVKELGRSGVLEKMKNFYDNSRRPASSKKSAKKNPRDQVTSHVKTPKRRLCKAGKFS